MLNRTRYFWSGFALGVGTGLVAREIAPFVKEASAPVLRSVVKIGVVVYERTQEAFWSSYESLEDMLHEARFDYFSQRKDQDESRHTRRKHSSEPAPVAVEPTSSEESARREKPTLRIASESRQDASR